MVNITYISDSHNKHDEITNDLNKIEQRDILVHAGDVSGNGSFWEVVKFLEWFDSLDFRYKIYIPGNHDFLFEEHRGLASNLINQYNRIHYLENSGVTIEGINFWGSPITPYFYNWAFNRFRGEDIKRYWDLIPENTDILITHGPPYKHGDEVMNLNHNDELNVGCKDLLEIVKEIRPKIHVFGHIHCGYGITHNDYTTFINAACLNEQYQYTNKPITLPFAKKKMELIQGLVEIKENLNFILNEKYEGDNNAVEGNIGWLESQIDLLKKGEI